MIHQDQLDKLVNLRHWLHQNPELSGKENNTIDRLCRYLDGIHPDIEKVRIGKGLLVVINGQAEGPTTMIRAELDALPIHEESALPYQSMNPGISHKCGHDGHMCMVIGLAQLLSDQPPAMGRVILLFQSAEETGQGARWMLEDPEFKQYQPDFNFALHNLPGHELGKVLLRKNTFCAASVGMKIKLKGHTAHASHPENGKSPAHAMARLAGLVVEIPQAEGAFQNFVLTTLTHMQLGEPTFGVSPGEGEMYFTLRAYLDQDLDMLQHLIKTEADRIAKEQGIGVEFSFHEAFEATMNHGPQVDLLEEVAKENKLAIEYMDAPNRWSEDFGLFLQQNPGAIFGLGSGLNQPALHHPDYDFPDELIESGLTMFWGVLKKLNY